jgi:uncharacterized protein (DUF1330 family)
MAVADLRLDVLRELKDDAPVAMLNLVRLRPESADGNGSGWAAYLRYSALVTPMIKARGGTILWAGDAETVVVGDPSGNVWDFAVLVQYPSRAAFIDMMTSPDYEMLANPHRTNGVADHVIIATRETYSKLGAAKPAGT